MIDYQDLEDRIASLERTTRNIGIGQDLVVGNLHILAEKLLFVRADKDSDLDYDALTSTSFDGDSFSTSTGTIDWDVDFPGVSSAAKAAKIRVLIRDSSATRQASYIYFQAKSTTTNPSLTCYGNEPSDAWNAYQGDVPIQSDGTSYYGIGASGSSTCDIHIQVVGWYV